MPRKSEPKPRARGRPFEKGDARAGRPKGTPNKATAEAKEACSALVDDPAYRKKLKERLLSGKLAPAVELMLWYYAKGKPKETHEVSLLDSPVTIYQIPDNGRSRGVVGATPEL